ALLGAFGVVLVPLGLIAPWEKKPAEPPPTQPAATPTASVQPTPIETHNNPATKNPNGFVSISSPRAGALVGREVMVRGTAKVAGASQLWVFVLAPGRGIHPPAFYVQTTDAVT